MPAPEDPAHDAELRRRVSRDLRDLGLDITRYVQAVARDLGVSTTDVHAVGVLQAGAGEPSAAELGAALGLTPSATTSLIDRLERAGHAVRETAAQDSRRARIVLTDTGRADSREHFAAMNDAVAQALSAAGPEDAETFGRVLADLVARVGAVNDTRRQA